MTSPKLETRLPGSFSTISYYYWVKEVEVSSRSFRVFLEQNYITELLQPAKALWKKKTEDKRENFQSSPAEY